jgi:hypothetical protein
MNSGFKTGMYVTLGVLAALVIVGLVMKLVK